MKRSQLLFVSVLLIALAAFSCKKKETYNQTDTSMTTETSATSPSSTSATDTTGTTTTTTGTTTTTSTAPLNDKDKDFVTSAGRGGIAEVALAQDALSHATDADVKTFAQTMVDDHTKANQELTQFASAHGITMPSELEAKLKEAKERLMKLTGKSFDQAFIKQMVEDHKDTIKKFEEESKSGSDKDLKKWVDDTLPKLREHLKKAEELESKLGNK